MACFSNRTRWASGTNITLNTRQLSLTTATVFRCIMLHQTTLSTTWWMLTKISVKRKFITFAPAMDRPGCPGMPCWPGIPRSPWKEIVEELKILFRLVFILTTSVLPTTGRRLIFLASFKVWVNVYTLPRTLCTTVRYYHYVL